MAPLLDVAVHIEKAPGVGRSLTDSRAHRVLHAVVGRRGRDIAKIDLEGMDVRRHERLIAGWEFIAVGEKRHGARSAGIFPLGLGRESVGPALLR